MRIENISSPIEKLSSEKISEIFAQFHALEHEWRAFVNQPEINNSLQIQDGFVRSFLTAQNLPTLIAKLDIFNQRAGKSIAKLAKKISSEYGVGLKPLKDRSALTIFQYLYVEEDETRTLDKIERFSSENKLTSEEKELLLLIQQHITLMNRVKIITELVFETANFVKAIFNTTHAIDQQLSEPINENHEDALLTQLLLASRCKNRLAESLLELRQQELLLALSLTDQNLVSLVNQRMKDFFKENAPKLTQLNHYIEAVQEKLTDAMRSNRANAEQLLDAIIRLHYDPQTIEATRSFIFQGEKSTRLMNFRRLALVVCEPRDLRSEDFFAPTIQNKYQLKAKLFFLYLSEYQAYKNLICNDGDFSDWFLSERNISHFNSVVRFVYEELCKPSSDLPRSFAADLTLTANAFIDRLRIPITPLQLFSPTLSYAKTEAADAICLNLAGKLDFQRFLLGHEGETALNAQEIRSWLIENRRQFIHETTEQTNSETLKPGAC